MEVLKDILALIVTLSILVTVHEWGHYFVARLCNVRVLRFSVGFGKPLYSFHGKAPAYPLPPAAQAVETKNNEPDKGTEFAIAAIPLGGYVKMLDEREGFVPDDQLHLAFNRKPVWQRIAVVLAGPLANFLLAILAYWFLFTVGVTGLTPMLGHVEPDSAAYQAGLRDGQEVFKVDDEPVETWSQLNLALFKRVGDTGDIEFEAGAPGDSRGQLYRIPVSEWLYGEESPAVTLDLGLRRFPAVPPVLDSVTNDSAAKKAGLEKDDLILRANGEAIDRWYQLVDVIEASPMKAVDLVVFRDGRELQLTAVPESRKSDGKVKGFLGVGAKPLDIPDEWRRSIRYPVYLAWIPAIEKTGSVTLFTLNAVKKMIMGALSHKNLSGPITIARVASDTASSGLESFIGFLALLSISLGVLNLMPIPLLDGGHLVYYLIEWVSGKPVPEKVQVWGLQVGMFLILSIMALAFYNDIIRL